MCIFSTFDRFSINGWIWGNCRLENEGKNDKQLCCLFLLTLFACLFYPCSSISIQFPFVSGCLCVFLCMWCGYALTFSIYGCLHLILYMPPREYVCVYIYNTYTLACVSGFLSLWIWHTGWTQLICCSSLSICGHTHLRLSICLFVLHMRACIFLYLCQSMPACMSIRT